jgi:hypothetical protein
VVEAREFGAMRDADDRGVGQALAEQGVQGALRFGIEAAGGFVEKQPAGLDEQCARGDKDG